jgi:hypothetical protein
LISRKQLDSGGPENVIEVNIVDGEDDPEDRAPKSGLFFLKKTKQKKKNNSNQVTSQVSLIYAPLIERGFKLLIIVITFE